MSHVFVSYSRKDSEQVIATESHHWIHSDQPELVVDAIQELVEAIRK